MNIIELLRIEHDKYTRSLINLNLENTMSIQSSLYAERANKKKDEWVKKLKASLLPRSRFTIMTYSKLKWQIEQVIKEIETYEFSE